MNFGGPVWHASGRANSGREDVSWGIAEQALGGVGDALLGEWREPGRNGVVHIRRRLSKGEGSGWVLRDIRGTLEETMRLRLLLEEAPILRQFYGHRLAARTSTEPTEGT